MAQFISNIDDDKNHKKALIDLFSGAIRLDWHIAFATQGGFDEIKGELESFFDAGNSARIIIGLDYCHTDPKVLKSLLDISEAYPGQLEFYIGGPDRECVFHPKTYVFYYENKKNEKFARVLIGSANLTSGGLEENFEFSAQLKLSLDKDGEKSLFLENLEKQISYLLRSGEVVTANAELIENYRIEHLYYKLHQENARKKALQSIERNSTEPCGFCEYYKVILEDFNRQPAGEDFESIVKGRLEYREMALGVLKNMSSQQNWTEESFLEKYRLLVSDPHYFHSGMLQIHQNSVARDRENFINGLHALENKIRQLGSMSPAVAYNTLRNFFAKNKATGMGGVSGADVNVMTEILHAYDNQSYAVMNKLSVDRLSVVSQVCYPASPSTNSVNGELYEEFCNEAKKLCDCLGLNNFTEFDALMNYDYFG